MANTMTLSRQELYDRIWAKPATNLAEELGISIAQLVKLCERHNLPRPASGHWSRMAWGQDIERPALPPITTPELDQVTIAPGAPHTEAVVYPPIPVPTRLSSPRPLVATAQAMLESKDRDRDGLAFSGGRGAVRIIVTPKNIGRAVRIMDTFVKAMEAKGFVLQPRGAYAHADVGMRKGGMDYPLKLREHLQRTELPLTPKQIEELKRWGHCFGDRYRHTPDGRLVFTFGEDYDSVVCQDTANTRLEDKLGRFVGRILQRMAKEEEQARRLAEERAARERVLAEQRRREEEAARLRQEEQDRIGALNDTITRWRLSRDVRDYVKQMRELIESHQAKATEGGPVARWLEWAEAYAAQIDPFTPLKTQLQKIQADQKK